MTNHHEPEVGDKVMVFWGYGLGFRREGCGIIEKVYAHSLRVRLTQEVKSPYKNAVGWPCGFVLKGIPRTSWEKNWRRYENSVELVAKSGTF